MVAITVILAAVIGTFVLGLGDSLGDSQPTAQLDAEIDYSNDRLVVEHNGGDSIESDELSVTITAGGADYSSDGTYANRTSVGDTVTADLNTTSPATINPGEEVRIRIIHESSESVLLDRAFEATSTFDIGDSFSLD
jgi:FlaG/FlaF family flagellin (archaellin)